MLNFLPQNQKTRALAAVVLALALPLYWSQVSTPEAPVSPPQEDPTSSLMQDSVGHPEGDAGAAASAAVSEKPLPPRPKPRKTETLAVSQPTHDLSEIGALLDGGDWQRALDLLRGYLADNPRDQDALVEMAMIHLMERQDPDAALPFLKRALEVDPDDRDIVAELLTTYSDMESLEEAVEFLKSVDHFERQTGTLDFGLGQALLELGRGEEAVEHLSKAIDHGGLEGTDAEDLLGHAYLEAGSYDDAVELFGRLLADAEEPSDQSRLTVLLAKSYQGLGDSGSAIELLEDLEAQGTLTPSVTRFLDSLRSNQ